LRTTVKKFSLLTECLHSYRYRWSTDRKWCGWKS